RDAARSLEGARERDDRGRGREGDELGLAQDRLRGGRLGARLEAGEGRGARRRGDRQGPAARPARERAPAGVLGAPSETPSETRFQQLSELRERHVIRDEASTAA